MEGKDNVIIFNEDDMRENMLNANRLLEAFRVPMSVIQNADVVIFISKFDPDNRRILKNRYGNTT